MWFSSWGGLGRTILIGFLAYLGLIILLRISGKRTLSKWNSFDFIVTVAFGSSLATVMLSGTVPLVDGIAGFALLIFLQYVVTSLSVRFSVIRRMVKAQPTLLLYRGEFRDAAMRKQRVSRSEVAATIRSEGIGSIREVEAVVLETDGSFSVITELAYESDSSLDNVEGFEEIHREQ